MMITATFKGDKVRVMVKSTKNCRVTFDLSGARQDGFLVPTEQLVFDDMVQPLVDAVKRHAQENYERDGWDYVVETFEDSEIHELVKTCRTPGQAIRRMAHHAGVLDDRRKDVQAEAF